jgi:hypothetical protein
MAASLVVFLHLSRTLEDRILWSLAKAQAIPREEDGSPVATDGVKKGQETGYLSLLLSRQMGVLKLHKFDLSHLRACEIHLLLEVSVLAAR